jgi:hypothetical protein
VTRGKLQLRAHRQRLAIARLKPSASIPGWVGGDFWSCTRTASELSIVCTERSVPHHIEADKGWVALEVLGPLALSEVGILAAIANPLGAAQVSIFVVSSYDTDYILVREQQLGDAIAALEAAGHSCSA